jgi:hypothetical protein
LSRVDAQTLRQLQDDGLCLVGESQAELWQLIAGVLSSSPKLVEEYRGFNLVSYRGKFYAFSYSLGPMDLERLKPKDWKELEDSTENIGRREWCGTFVGRSLQDLKDKVDAQAAMDDLAHCPEPRLVLAGYQGYNLVLWKSDYYGLHQGLGPLELPTAAKELLADSLKRKAIVVGRSLTEVQEQVDRATALPNNEPLAPPADKHRRPHLRRLLGRVRRFLSRT